MFLNFLMIVGAITVVFIIVFLILFIIYTKKYLG